MNAASLSEGHPSSSLDMSHTATNCCFCRKKLGEGNGCSRVLGCSHTLCNRCVGQLTEYDIRGCPVCPEESQANSLNKDRTTKSRVLGKFTNDSQQEQAAKRRRNTAPFPPSKRRKQMDGSSLDLKSNYALMYAETQEQIAKLMKEISHLEGDISHQSSNFEQNILPDITKALSLDDEVEANLEEMSKNLQNKLKRIAAMNSCLFDEDSLEHSDDSDVTEEGGSSCDEWIRNCKSNLLEDEKYLESLREALNQMKAKADRLEDVLYSNATGAAGSGSDPAKVDKLMQSSNIVGYIKADTLRDLSGLIKNLVEGGMVYAFQDSNGKRNYAPISLVDGQYLCLSHLTEETPNAKAFVVEYEKVLKIIDAPNRLVFLQLRSVNAQKYLGTLIIRLTDNSKRAQNFWLMCSGEKGPSYTDSPLLEVSGKGEDVEHVGFGDYEGKGGYGGKSLVPGAGDELGSHLKQHWVAGTVTGEDCYGGDETAAQFKIFTRDRPKVTLDLAFGNVVEGLSSLTKAISRYSEINKVIVSECGIVIKSV